MVVKILAKYLRFGTTSSQTIIALVNGTNKLVNFQPRAIVTMDSQCLCTRDSFHQVKKYKRCSKLMRNLRLDRLNNQTCDVIINVEKEKFAAHKSVLANACEYFRAMLTGSFLESGKREIKLIGISKEEFRFILDYMYGVNLDFSDITGEKLLRVCQLADRLCFEDLREEVEAFFGQVKYFDNCTHWYPLAIAFGHQQAMKDIRFVFFGQLLDTYFWNPEILRPGTLNRVALGRISFELFRDTIEVFETTEFTPKSEHLSTLRYVRILEVVVTEWIRDNPNFEQEKYTELLDFLDLEELSFMQAELMVEWTRFGSSEFVADILLRHFAAINENLGKLKLRTTLVFIRDGYVELADFSMKKNEWVHHSIEFKSKVKRYTADGDTIYFLKRDGCLTTFNMDTTEFADYGVEILPRWFQCLNIYSVDGVMYAYGEDRATNKATVITLERTTQTTKTYDLMVKIDDNRFPGLTIADYKLVFENGGKVHEFDPKTEDLKCLAKNYPLPEPKFALAKAGDDVFLLKNDGKYLKNPGATQRFQFKTVGEPRNNLFSSGSILVVGENVYVAVQSKFEPDLIKIYRYSKPKERFEALGFLPKSFQIQGSAGLILRRDK